MATAKDLSSDIWNALADYIDRASSPREIYFATVTKNDTKRKIIWVADFGDVPIPLVGLLTSFAHFDTQPSGSLAKREDKTQTNPAYFTEVVTPKVGAQVIIIDPWGVKRFPICIGVVHSKAGFWEN